jgi:hypothetical protein
MPLESNAPAVEMRFLIVKRKHNGSAAYRCYSMVGGTPSEPWMAQEWPSGRPTEAQLRLLVAKAVEHLEHVILQTVGIQGEFPGLGGSPLPPGPGSD